MRRNLHRGWDGASPSLRCASLLQHGANEGHGETALGDDRRLIERVEQIVQRAHVARKTALQITRSLLRQIKPPHLRAQLERLALLGLIEHAQLKDRSRCEAR